MTLTIGVDVGGTKVAAGVVDDHGRIVEKLRRPTPSTSPHETAAVIAEVVDILKGKFDEVEAVGLGAAGFVDESRSMVLFAPNLAWRDEPLKKKVESQVGLPVIVENDANATAWGEAKFGAGRGEDHIVLITLGTGIGGGLIMDGDLYRGRFGIGGEFGHFRVVPDGRRCGCGNRGCWEQYASGNALVAEALVLLEASGVDGRTGLDVLAGGLAGSRVLDLKRESMVNREFAPGFRIDLHHKDMGIALAAAREADVALPMTGLVAQLVAAARSQGHGSLDHSALLKVVENISGKDRA
ncbi:ROK family protein [Actinoallomurus acaciae]|uniref:ROK family protein n=1 Tax=Actinoallomurus acaciae TaxID=502577 RepID=A0ABV5YQR3_9ACTN